MKQIIILATLFVATALGQSCNYTVQAPAAMKVLLRATFDKLCLDKTIHPGSCSTQEEWDHFGKNLSPYIINVLTSSLECNIKTIESGDINFEKVFFACHKSGSNMCSDTDRDAFMTCFVKNINDFAQLKNIPEICTCFQKYASGQVFIKPIQLDVITAQYLLFKRFANCPVTSGSG